MPRPEIKYDLGSVVYLKTDLEARPRVVTRIQLSGVGLIYLLQHSDEGETAHYEYEITNDPVFE